MRYLYDLFFIVFAVLYLPVLVFKGKAHKDFLQRFGCLPESVRCTGKKTIWVHTVSVGEVIAAQLLVRRLGDDLKGFRVCLSVTTKTGYDTAVKLFGNTVPVFYFPVDMGFAVKKAIEWVMPAMVILVETELWPNFIINAHEKKIPVFLVNGRISERSYRGYRLIRWGIRPALERITLFCMRSEDDARRIILMGAPKDRVRVTGNIKYDVSGVRQKVSDADTICKRLGIVGNNDIIVGGSTHPGEETVLLDIYRGLLAGRMNTVLILAPRHIDRVPELEVLIRRYGFTPVRVSRIGSDPHRPTKTPVYIVDGFGYLSDLYSIATVVFVGGSLIKKGGHNILEAARHKKAVLFGPYMHNFQDIADSFRRKQAARMVGSKEELRSAILDLLNDAAKRNEAGERAYELVEENKGAVERVVSVLKETHAKIS